jgi:hypothetical protein
MTVKSLSLGPRQVELELAVLVHRADGRHGLGALAVLADALGPELHPPAGEALQPVRVGHGDGDALARMGGGHVEGRAHGGGGLPGREAGAERLVGLRRPLADGRDVEAEHGGGQQPHVGEHRIAPADARMVFEEAHALGLQEIAQGVPAPGLAGLGQAEEQVLGQRLQARLLQGGEHGDGLHQGLARAAGLGDRHVARRGMGQLVQDPVEGGGVEIVEEVDPRALGEAARARHRVVPELRQGLPAEARPAGAEEHHVGGVLAQPGGGLPHGRKVVGGAGHVQQGQPARGVVLGKPLHGLADLAQGGLERRLLQAALPDAGGEGEIDRLLKGH